MSGEDKYFKEGIDRAKDGKSTADPILDFDSPGSEESAARERGFEAGETAKATAEEQSKKDSDK